MGGKFIGSIFVILLGFGAGWYWFSAERTDTEPLKQVETLTDVIPEDTAFNENIHNETTESGEIEEEAVPVEIIEISYTDTGFVPGVITVAPDTLVKFINNSSGGMWVASDMHPTHQLLPGFDQGENSMEYEYLFDKIGTWTYHNDMSLERVGTIIVAR